MNNAPFYVGQKVVCLKTDERKIVIKKNTYTVHDIFCCSNCITWHILISETPVNTSVPYDCCGIQRHVEYYGAPARYFAPIEPLYSDITAELASKVEVGDTADQPVRVLSN